MGRPVMFRQRRLGMDDTEFEIRKFRTMKSEGGPTEEPELADKLPELMLERDLAPGRDRERRSSHPVREIPAQNLDGRAPPAVQRAAGRDVADRPAPGAARVRARRSTAPFTDIRDRHRVKSGITGWAQVHGLRGKTSLSDRVEWDNYYIENWSLWLDLKIALHDAIRHLQPRCRVAPPGAAGCGSSRSRRASPPGRWRWCA